MKARHSIGLVLFVMAMAMYAAAQQTAAPEIKHVPIKSTSPASGKDMYNNYCAVCHGKDGKGAGPAAAAMKTVPTDLTTLAKMNGGKYPSAHVATVIRGEADLPAHGSKDMPVWGPLFMSVSQGHEAQVQQRIANIVEYIQSLQVK